MWVALLLLVLPVLLVIAWWYYEYFKCNKYLKRFPGPTPLPIVGNALLVRNTTDVVPVGLQLMAKFNRDGVVKLWIGHQPRLMICNSKSAEFLLGSTTILEKSYEYRYLHDWFGTGLLTSSKTKWRKYRKLLTPTFHFRILEQYLQIVDVQSEIFLEKLSAKAGGKPFDIFPHVSLYTLDVICEAAMGTQVNAQKNSDSEYVHSVEEMCRIVMERIRTPLKMFDLLFYFTKDYTKQKKALRVLHGYTNSVIKSRKNELKKNPDLNLNLAPDDVGMKQRLAFLDLLLSSTVDGQPLSDEDIREEVDLFMFAGHDTTASGTSFAFYCLSKHPEIQEKVVEELRGIFGNDNKRSATYQELQNMKYLEMVLKETLRLYPSVPFYSRTLDEDVEFDGGILPKGLPLTVFPLGIHMQPEFFPNPEKFDPERFSPENSVKRAPYAYVPFSAGPRNCIGQRFAMLEMKSLISKLLRNYELLCVPDHKVILKTEAVLKSDNGVLVNIRKRKF